MTPVTHQAAVMVVFPILLILLAFLFFVMVAGGRDTTTTTTEGRSGTLAGNQVDIASKNQFNLFSDVTNCYGDASCIFYTTQQTTTVNTVTSVSGDRNIVNPYVQYLPDGTPICLATGNAEWNNETCYQHREP